MSKCELCGREVEKLLSINLPICEECNDSINLLTKKQVKWLIVSSISVAILGICLMEYIFN